MSVLRPTIRLTRRAERDIENVLLYTRRTRGVEQTTIYRRAFAKTWSLLRNYPRLGQPRDDLLPGCRTMQVEHHVIYYHQPQPTEIEVIRILHQRQDPTGKIDEPAL